MVELAPSTNHIYCMIVPASSEWTPVNFRRTHVRLDYSVPQRGSVSEPEQLERK